MQKFCPLNFDYIRIPGAVFKSSDAGLVRRFVDLFLEAEVQMQVFVSARFSELRFYNSK